MKRLYGSMVFLGLFAGLVAVILVLSAASGSEGAFLPGVTVADEHPNGCVDCHRQAGPDKDYRLNVSLAELPEHPKIDQIVKTIPNDCAMCHKEGAPAGPLNLITHRDHYRNPEENHFISNYQGACLNCHSLEAASGVMGMKSGAKNW